MSKSTNVLGNLKSTTTTAFGSTAELAAVDPGHRMQSPEGLASLAYLKAQELYNIMIQMVGVGGTGGVVASGDPNFTALDGVRQVLIGSGSGKSTQVITDLAGCTTTAFGATAKAAAIAAAGPIMSLEGMAEIALIKADEIVNMLNQMVLDQNGATTNAVVKSGDANFTNLDNVRQVFV